MRSMLPMKIIGAPAINPKTRFLKDMFGVAKIRPKSARIDFQPTQSFIISTVRGPVFVGIERINSFRETSMPLENSSFSTAFATKICACVASKLIHKRK